MQNIEVFRLAEQVQFVESEFNELKKFLLAGRYSKVFILVDENTKIHCLPIVERVLKKANIIASLLEVPAGESSKHINICCELWQRMTEENADRKSLLINLGGGMITDLGGFIASIYKRGIDFVNIPTSLLAMVDASVGGKCGIDFTGYKNQLGVFQEAERCFINTSFLQTLPQIELVSGYAEMVKHALIENWVDLKTLSNFKSIPSKHSIQRSIEVKSKIVLEDPKEKKERKKLNFGHTIGHAIESFLLNSDRAVTHGIAISAGMICEVDISHKLGILSTERAVELKKLLIKEFPKVEYKEEKISQIIKYLQQDKKNEGGFVQFSLLKNIGECVVNQKVSDEIIHSSLLDYIRCK